MYLPMPGRASSDGSNFFNPLVRYIEQMIVEGRAPYPVERTLLTSGMTLAAVDSLHRGDQRVETPEMEVRYSAPRESLYWRTWSHNIGRIDRPERGDPGRAIVQGG